MQNNKEKSGDKQKPDSVTAKIEQLDHEVEWFYGDDFQLDKAVEKYQAATKLATEIDQELTNLKNQVKVIADFTKS